MVIRMLNPYFLVGEILKPQGVHGEAKVKPYAAHPDDFKRWKTLYLKDGENYRAERPNRDTLLFFCHFGVECVMLSHLLGISPMPLWHGTCALTTSVTTLVTEERRQGIASFRMCGFGDRAWRFNF